MDQSHTQPSLLLAPKRELFAWAMFDFANSGYTTVVLTAVFNAYFVRNIAGEEAGFAPGTGTLLWSIAIAIANAIVLCSAPLLGAYADRGANKKRLLVLSTLGCIFFTALLAKIGAGDVLLGMSFVILATVMFSSGENLIAAFLPEIAPPNEMGRISGYGWSLGYLGGILVLSLCLAYTSHAQAMGAAPEDYVPVTMLITAACFGLAAIPTMLWLPERALPTVTSDANPSFGTQLRASVYRLVGTLRHARHYRDLFRFLGSLTLFSCGTQTVVVLAAVYAQEALHFNVQDTLKMILIVNFTAAAGAFAFGHFQQRIGSLRTLTITLLIWILAILIAYFARSRGAFWVAANLVGIALGSSQSAGRALVGQFTPPAQTAEFFGLWGVALRLAAIVGPLCYGALSALFHGNQRIAILSTLSFFVLGLVMLIGIDEQRGRLAAQTTIDQVE